jgi:hypothetical protein
MESAYMKMFRDIIINTDFEIVATEIRKHYGHEHIQDMRRVFTKLKNTPYKSNINSMIIFIRALKENEQGDEDIVVQDFESNDTTLTFDVCGEDNKYDGLYSIASSEYDQLLGYYVDQSTIEKFTYSQIIAHILWEIQWE